MAIVGGMTKGAMSKAALKAVLKGGSSCKHQNLKRCWLGSFGS